MRIQCLTVSLIALVMGLMMLSVQATFGDTLRTSFLNPYPNPIGLLVAMTCAMVGIRAYFACPPKPRFAKYAALVLATLNIWMGVDTGVNYLRHAWPAFRHWVDSMPLVTL